MFHVEYAQAFNLLSDQLDECFSRGGQLTLVNGCLGSGKTRLLHEFARNAVDSGALVLSAAGSRAERDLQLGVIDQLLQHVDLPDKLAERIADFHADVQTPMEQKSGQRVSVRLLQRIRQSLLERCNGCPLVIVVDDMQFVDAASLQVLLFLQRRMRSRLMMVLSEWEHPQQAKPLFRAEVTRLPHLRIKLKLLARSSVRELLEEFVDHSTARRLAPAFHWASGGNPILVNALIEDYLLAPSDTVISPEPPGAGRAFGRAVLTCLHRWEPQTLDVACGLAILGERSSPVLLSRLLDLGQERVGDSISILTSAGLVLDRSLRCSEAAAGILGSLPHTERSALHLRAAALLYELGAPAVEISAHFRAAGGADGDWAAEILCQAAEQSLAGGDHATAALSLELALGTASGEQHHNVLKLLFRVAWQINPSAALIYLAPLQRAVQCNMLADHDVVALIRLQLWRGDIAGAAAVLRETGSSGLPMSREAASELLLLLHWFFGGAHGAVLGEVGELAEVGEPAAGDPLWSETARILTHVWSEGGDEYSTSTAERVLRHGRLTCAHPEGMIMAILALAYGNQPDKALAWCDELIERFSSATTLLAQLHAVRAEVSLRGGDPAAAVEFSESALSLLREDGWGVLIAHPLTVLIQANLALDRVERAADAVRRPVPEMMFQTVLGVRYLHARGRFAMASGRVADALDTFHECAVRLAAWDLHIPVLVPLAVGIVEASLWAGDLQTARGQLTAWFQQPATGDDRTRGLLLRLRAIAGDPAERPELLRQASDALRRAGDRWELARVESELILCAAAPHSRMSRQATPPARESVPAVSEVAQLSGAERRVAELAARGHSNRDIGGLLGITVSTVEQHLTRVYRKLAMFRRADLAGLFD